MNFEFSYKKNKIIFLFALIPIIIVIYNTSRIWDIYDASYILENAYFISLGKIPYRDFMIHVTPGSFFMQAFIIKFIGFTLYSQIIYCSIISVLTFLLTFRILFFFNSDKWLNIAIALPVSVTGGYGILSTPFYDPDTVFFSLISIFIIILCYKKSFPPLLTFFAGLCAFLPFFFKQNIGIAYMFAINVFLIAVVFYKNEGLNLRKYLLFLTGTITAIALFIFYLLATSSINDFYNCIFGYTFGHYLKSRSSSFAQNFDIKALKYTFIILIIIPALKYLHIKKIWLYFVVLLLAVTPLYLIPFYKLVIKDLDFYLEFLIILPVFVNIFIIAAVYSFIWLKELPIFIRLIPFLILTVIYADIMSHGYWGSHYGVWPLFSLLFSSLFLILSKSLFKKHISLLRGLVIVNCIIIAVSMFFYITTNKFYTIFLEFDFNKKVYHSETNNIKGLSLPGEMVPNMDNLFKFVQTEIPANDPIIIVMHEDPFYIATGRYPHFPVLINDVTLDFFPYQEMVEKINSYNIKWMIIKTELQTYFLHDTTFTGKYLFPLISHLKESFILYKNLPGYQIYKKPD